MLRETEKIKHTVTFQNITCYAVSEDISGNTLKGPEVSLEMAYREGWFDKDGSKWLTMPEVMLNYRAAAFFGRVFCPDILMGMHTDDEIMDINEDDAPKSLLRSQKPTKKSDLNEILYPEPDYGKKGE